MHKTHKFTFSVKADDAEVTGREQVRTRREPERNYSLFVRRSDFLTAWALQRMRGRIRPQGSFEWK